MPEMSRRAHQTCRIPRWIGLALDLLASAMPTHSGGVHIIVNMRLPLLALALAAAAWAQYPSETQ